MKTSIQKLPHATAVLNGVIPADEIAKTYDAALNSIIAEVELPGFRKGKVPRERVIQEVGERAIWRSAAERVLRSALADILKEHALIPFLPPEITLETKEHGAEVSFTVSVTTPPTCLIHDATQVATKALSELQPLPRDEELHRSRTALSAQVAAMLKKQNDEPISDVDAATIGFENAATLHTFIESEAVRAVDHYESQRKRGAVADALIANAEAHIPAVLIDDEVRAMVETAKRETASQGMPWNQYLEKRGMSEEAVMNEMRGTAEKRIILDLVFAHLAQEKKLKPIDAEVHRIAHALMHEGAPSERAHQYAAEVSIREQVWGDLGLTTEHIVEQKEHKKIA